MNGAFDVVTRPRRFGGGAATAATATPAGVAGAGAGAAGGGRRCGVVQNFSRLFTRSGYCSSVAVISAFRVSISAFHFATRASEPTTVEASPVSRFAA